MQLLAVSVKLLVSGFCGVKYASHQPLWGQRQSAQIWCNSTSKRSVWKGQKAVCAESSQEAVACPSLDQAHSHAIDEDLSIGNAEQPTKQICSHVQTALSLMASNQAHAIAFLLQYVSAASIYTASVLQTMICSLGIPTECTYKRSCMQGCVNVKRCTHCLVKHELAFCDQVWFVVRTTGKSENLTTSPFHVPRSHMPKSTPKFEIQCSTYMKKELTTRKGFVFKTRVYHLLK